jgi:hypothetical protein
MKKAGGASDVPFDMLRRHEDGYMFFDAEPISATNSVKTVEIILGNDRGAGGWDLIAGQHDLPDSMQIAFEAALVETKDPHAPTVSYPELGDSRTKALAYVELYRLPADQAPVQVQPTQPSSPGPAQMRTRAARGARPKRTLNP